MPPKKKVERFGGTYYDPGEHEQLAEELYAVGKNWDQADKDQLKKAAAGAAIGEGGFSANCVNEEDVEVRHISKGKRGKEGTATIFYYLHRGNLAVVAAGRHSERKNGWYEIDPEIGQKKAPFEKRRTVGTDGEEPG
ncbi:hypothetical protein ACQPYE_13760 [Actinosynnema sp. CA-299493]